MPAAAVSSAAGRWSAALACTIQSGRRARPPPPSGTGDLDVRVHVALCAD